LGDVMRAQGDGQGALEAFNKSLALRETLTALDPSNTQWQRDLAVACAKLGILDAGQSTIVRRDHLDRGKAILLGLKSAGRLWPNEDRINWFSEQIGKLSSSGVSDPEAKTGRFHGFARRIKRLLDHFKDR